MARMIEVRAEVECPDVPEMLYGRDISLSIADLTDEGLREIGAQWTDALLRKAAALREARK